jgi:hypothetical protein
MMLQPIEQCVDERLLVEQIIPVRQIEVCSDDCRDAVVALIHQPEEGVGLFWLERQVAELVDLCCAQHKLTHVKSAVTWSHPMKLGFLAVCRASDST